MRDFFCNAWSLIFSTTSQTIPSFAIVRRHVGDITLVHWQRVIGTIHYCQFALSTQAQPDGRRRIGFPRLTFCDLFAWDARLGLGVTRLPLRSFQRLLRLFLLRATLIHLIPLFLRILSVVQLCFLSNTQTSALREAPPSVYILMFSPRTSLLS